MVRHSDKPALEQIENPFPSAGEDRLRAHLDPDTPQTRSPAYRLGFADNELLLRDELRPVRLQLEFLKPDLLQQDQGVELTVALFGSARIHPPEVAERRLAEAEHLATLNPDDDLIAEQYRVARAMVKKARFYEEARRLARLVSGLQLATAKSEDVDETPSYRPRPAYGDVSAIDDMAAYSNTVGTGFTAPADDGTETTTSGLPVFVVTGGGPGIMEAANRGAHDVGAASVAHNIVLPFEQTPNEFVTPELCFNFHYFALRKMHFLVRSVALVVFPGGFGTLDELFEVLTLIQTHKIKPIPVLLFGKEYWEHIVHFEGLVDEGVVSRADLDIFSYVETAEEAWCILEPVLKQAALTCRAPGATA